MFALIFVRAYTVYDWEKASAEFKETYYVMYDIAECFGCGEKYKYMPGFIQSGKGSLRFYSAGKGAHHPGYCSEYCGRVLGPYSADWSEPED